MTAAPMMAIPMVAAAVVAAARAVRVRPEAAASHREADRRVETLAGRAVPGEIIDVKLYRNKERYIYKVKIIQRSGSIYDVRIDAVSRKLLSARER